MPILNWDEDRERIVGRLQTHGTLKVCAKVLDEPSLIEGWILHHEKIVGFGNLIIADNGSTDPHTLKVYQDYQDRVTIFRFKGPHNEIHWHPRFSEFFHVLKSTCKYFSFVDVDERLVWLDQSFWLGDESIIHKLENSTAVGIIPTTWLINVLNSLDRFCLLDTESTSEFTNNLRWGKPILTADLIGVQSGIHNVQFDRFVFSNEFGAHFFLLHYTQFPERRIAVNKNKLVSRGVVEKNSSIEEILSIDLARHQDESVARFVREIRLMTNAMANGIAPEDEDFDFIKFEQDGRLYYSNDHSSEIMSYFLKHGSELIALILGGAKPDQEQLDDPACLLLFAKTLRDQGQGAGAEWLYRRGMARFPDFLDVYEAPAFRKELMRMLLARGDWEKAKQLAPSREEEPDGPYWHFVLLARAYAQRGDDRMAELWWRRVMEREPNHHEARTYLETRLSG